jgi:2-polyprenyl-3-methyl-5-hydroxy-6-metoxy-1,4-benzoquinol methylase
MAGALQQPFVYGGVDSERLPRGLGRISGRLLDVGSGGGSWAPRLRGAGADHLVALDCSRDAIALAGERYELAVVGAVEGLEDPGG